MARILLVEDSPTEAAALARLLQGRGHEVSRAATAEEALELCRAKAPELVLMDVVLPGMSGFQATRQLSRDEATRHIPVLIISTKGMETDKAWGMRQGARGYVVKPVNETDLLAQIDSLVG